jgi:hypothetical protein
MAISIFKFDNPVKSGNVASGGVKVETVLEDIEGGT